MKRQSTLIFHSLTALCAMGVAMAPANAMLSNPSKRGEQSEARQQFMAGKVKSLRDIEAMVLPRMRGMQYLGPEYDSSSQVYRLKFISDGRVVFVDVDARSGRVLRQTG